MRFSNRLHSATNRRQPRACHGSSHWVKNLRKEASGAGLRRFLGTQTTGATHEQVISLSLKKEQEHQRKHQ